MYFMFENAPAPSGRARRRFNKRVPDPVGSFPALRDVHHHGDNHAARKGALGKRLERILTTPLRRLDLLIAYGTAFFRLPQRCKATLACVVSFWLLGFDTAGSPLWVFLIAIVNAVLGSRPRIVV